MERLVHILYSFNIILWLSLCMVAVKKLSVFLEMKFVTSCNNVYATETRDDKLRADIPCLAVRE